MPGWEKILALPNGGGAFRSRVPGGWLVLATYTLPVTTGLTFVSDAGHEWSMTTARRRWAGPSEWNWEEMFLPRGIPGIGALVRGIRMYRCPVPGGWLVLALSTAPSLTFYPDPEHLWVEDAATELEAADEPEGTGTELVAG